MKFNYMSPDGKILTNVHVNNLTKRVTIKNHTDNIYDCAFGVKTRVTYDDVMEFLEDRTFPRNRADIADILNVLNLKKYDAYLMCKKLGGRTEQDNNWIDFLED